MSAFADIFGSQGDDYDFLDPDGDEDDEYLDFEDFYSDEEGDVETDVEDAEEMQVGGADDSDPTLRRSVRPPLNVAVPLPRAVDGNEVLLADHFYTISRSFGVRAIEYVFEPNVVSPRDDVWTAFLRFMNRIFDMIEREFAPRDFVQFSIFSRDLTDNRMVFPVFRVSNISRHIILDRMEAVIQSNSNVAIDSGDFSVEVQHVVLPEARGYESSRNILLLQMEKKLLEVLKNTRCLVSIDPKMDPFCAAVSLLVAKYCHECRVEGSPMRVNRAFRTSPRLRRECRQLFRQAGLSCSRGVYLDEFRGLSKLNEFREYEIKLFAHKPHLQVLLHVNEDAPLGPLYLYLHNDSHLYVVKSVNALFGKTGALCSQCNKFFTGHVKTHTCDRFCCKQCKCKCDTYRTPNAVASIRCSTCLRSFLSKNCYDLHLRRGASRLVPVKFSVCSRIMACKTCGRDLKARNFERTAFNAYELQGKSRHHVCFSSFCRTCYRNVDTTKHLCHVRPIHPQKEKFQDDQGKKRGKRWFFDVECCDVERVCEDGVLRHFFVPNLVVLQSEYGEEHVWDGEGCIESFCDFLFLATDDCLAASPTKHTVFAHNASGFDTILILKVLCENMCEDPQIIFDGAKALQLKIGSVTVRDSYRYFQTALKNLPKPFGLTCVKGYFPHKFNTFENEDYDGDLPEQSYFGVDFMKEKDFKEFDVWWKQRDSDIRRGVCPTWNLKRELLLYCRDDVKILREAWLKFEERLANITGIVPGVNDVSIASYTNAVFRSLVAPDTIGVIPSNNYVKHVNQSRCALEWLIWLDQFYLAGELSYSGKGADGEHRVDVGGKKLHVDGYHAPTRCIFEFAGCYYHGCPICTLPDVKSFHNNKRNRELYVDFQNRIGNLRLYGYDVEVMWECEWKEMKETDADLLEQLAEVGYLLPSVESLPIDPRDALYGGRTEAFSVLFHRKDEKEEEEEEEELEEATYVKGLDFNSLYPAMMSKREYPIGHPTLFHRPTDYTLDKYFGLIKAKLVPPRGLYIPVLPVRILAGEKEEVKLMFPLCFTCARNLEKGVCFHDDEQRAISGTWPSPEVYEAMRQGYVVKEFYWVWHYPYRSDDLFKPFVRTFFKYKLEASGYPAWCVDDQSKAKYVADCLEKEGVVLDPDSIAYDAVLRFIAKIILNSSWGKFAQNPYRKTTVLTHGYAPFLKLLSDHTKVDKNFRFVNPETVILTARDNKSCIPPSGKGSLVHADFVTCYGRLAILRVLQQCGSDSLYTDTDSAFFISRACSRQLDFEPPVGPYLGELESVFDDGVVCNDFVAMGPKNYGYATSDGKTVVKVRGITFNRTACQVLNLKLMINMVERSSEIHERDDPKEKERLLCPVSGFVKEVVPVERFTMVRGNPLQPFDIAPQVVERNFRGVFDKRVIDFRTKLTYPYGF